MVNTYTWASGVHYREKSSRRRVKAIYRNSLRIRLLNHPPLSEPLIGAVDDVKGLYQDCWEPCCR